MSPGVSTRPRVDRAPAPRALPTPRWANGARAVLADALGGLRRNALMVAAATTTITIALAVAGAGFLVSANLGHIATMLEGQVEIVGFFRGDLAAADQQRALSAVRALPTVRSAEIVTRLEALQRLQRTFQAMASINELLPSNPLPDSVEVRVVDPARVRDVAAALRQIPGIDEVIYGAPIVDRLAALTRAVRVAGVVMAALLASAALLIIVNTIRLTVAARRQEIEIMTLVGATPGFVRGPFVVEGVLQGVGAAVLASGALCAGYLVMAGQASSALPFLPLVPPPAVLPQTLVLVWALGIAVGIAGSEIGLRRHLAG